MSLRTQEQIEHAWQLLNGGAPLEELSKSWSALARTRHQLDHVVFELAQAIEVLRATAAEAAEEQTEESGERATT
jgi:hypothetical protein